MALSVVVKSGVSCFSEIFSLLDCWYSRDVDGEFRDKLWAQISGRQQCNMGISGRQQCNMENMGKYGKHMGNIWELDHHMVGGWAMPLWKNYELISWDEEIPPCIGIEQIQTTNQNMCVWVVCASLGFNTCPSLQEWCVMWSHVKSGPAVYSCQGNQGMLRLSGKAMTLT